jgi:hypothetical protein
MHQNMLEMKELWSSPFWERHVYHVDINKGTKYHVEFLYHSIPLYTDSTTGTTAGTNNCPEGC